MRLGLDRSERAQRVARSDRALDAQHYNSAFAFGLNRGAAQLAQIVYKADRGAALDVIANFYARYKKPVVRRGMVNLQMRLIGISGRAENLVTQLSFAFGGYAPNCCEQVEKSAFERAQIAGVDIAGAATLHIDRGNIAVKSRTQCAARQKGARPAPKRIEARGHRALRSVYIPLVADESGPRQQFIRATCAVQIDIVGGLSEHLGVEKMRQTLRDTSSSFSGKRAGEIHFVCGRRSEAGVISCFIQYGDHDHRAAKRLWAPVFGPLAQKRGAFVFVTVGGAIDHQHGSVSAAPYE